MSESEAWLVTWLDGDTMVEFTAGTDLADAAQSLPCL